MLLLASHAYPSWVVILILYKRPVWYLVKKQIGALLCALKKMDQEELALMHRHAVRVPLTQRPDGDSNHAPFRSVEQRGVVAPYQRPRSTGDGAQPAPDESCVHPWHHGQQHQGGSPAAAVKAPSFRAPALTATATMAGRPPPLTHAATAGRSRLTAPAPPRSAGAAPSVRRRSGSPAPSPAASCRGGRSQPRKRRRRRAGAQSAMSP